jgi:four helix bundle protein
MTLDVHRIALQAIGELRVLMPRIRRHDRDLANQLRRSASSIALNIGEAAYSDPGTSKARFHSAAGSANETRTALAVAIAWGYTTEEQAASALVLLDRVIAMLWRLTH